MNLPQTMACPADGTQLVMSERQGIEIDYCPACRGVWLDRGELDKIIERNTAETAPAPRQASPLQQEQWGRHDNDYGRPQHGKRRKGFLENLFD